MALPSRRKQRVSKACDFCRRRKLRCDNSEPRCANCQVRAVDCTYASRVKRARPSNARIQNLEEENVRLRQSLRRQSPSSVAGITPDSNCDSSFGLSGGSLTPGRDVTAAASFSITTASASRIAPGSEARVFQDSTFHGPSSTLTGRNHDPGRGHQSDDQIKDQLLASATRQRQLETMNMRTGKLDFDGTDPALAMQLLANFWNRQHFAGSTVYRPVFMRDMATTGPYFSKLLLNAMLFAGSKHSEAMGARDNSNVDSIGRPFRRKFDEILHDSETLFKSSIPTIQSLLIVADALFSWCDEKSLSWHYMGLAISMMIDLGIHADHGWRTLAPEDAEVRRRVFWAAFALDKIQAIYQGRPQRLREADNRVPIKFLDEYEELECFNTLTYSYSPAQLDLSTHSVTTFEQLCKLSIVMDRIISCLYAEQSLMRDVDDLLLDANRLHSELERWRSELPAHLVVRLDEPSESIVLPHTVSLLAMYNSLIILLHRPFVSDGHLQSASETTARDAFSKCVAAAFEINRLLQVYKQHFCLKSVPYFISYATYVGATIHVRLAAQTEPSSAAHQCLKMCFDTLAEQQHRCHAPRRTLAILLGLSKKLGVDVGNVALINSVSCVNGNAAARSETTTTTHASQDQQASDNHVAGDTNDNLGNDAQVDFDALMEDFDMDEILRSFDATHAPIDDAGNTTWDTNQVDPGTGISSWSMGPESHEYLFYSDSLFGFGLEP